MINNNVNKLYIVLTFVHVLKQPKHLHVCTAAPLTTVGGPVLAAHMDHDTDV